MGVLSCKERLLLSLRTRVDPSTHVRGSTTVTSVAEDLILSSSFCGHPHTCGIQKFDTHTIKQSIVSQKYVCPLLFMSLCQNRKQLKERRVCFHAQWTIMAAGVWGTAHIHSQEAEKDRHWCSGDVFLLPTSFSLRSQSLRWCWLLLEWVLSREVDHSGNYPDVPRDVSPGWF